MHEIGIAKGILKKALELATSSKKSKKVIKIKVKAGIGEMIIGDSLQFAFSRLAKGTAAAGAEIELEEFEGVGISIESVELEE
ncbi:hypothetical protein COY52_09285 [Candidatus Desantisbacteria bacterium CG_4_10_14_0_8_um_filter_48_22]|uniref:Hydrogenase maturation nickel metallochaperone HypA n=1 Tax=Candidatus Desantisbacteria bacterium CG_4_10_14_0_8_um_filter_48_22 TaxID=1974543 RepID=A0A2M7S7T3_9BACT|nr:MAG: hypothetical protein AUJ67_06695 [Candidatus Desantisbacteria bacterium CG1_02_49_89]PIV57256.1 MAG: hypothetical protein COS16_01205 [Candidatus Desantisbacteria bacterium CG02_land_8_20_14_3_00_49_13]PIZ15591.1 MAG: hypothetical protein COY52_09285 [Candidatus Desantisbacteria bacterium CG_4_10_14_0_8_um_filter_48_22]PJB28603.1 MAG: hypothetical protein CO111_01210 [Candidatus Desantisbacteria bacterium CG_4_9_14_3_um_filter_50_7]